MRLLSAGYSVNALILTTRRQVRRWIRQAKKDSTGSSEFFVAEMDGKVVSHVSVELKRLHLGEGFYVKTDGIGGVCAFSDNRMKGIMTNLHARPWR